MASTLVCSAQQSFAVHLDNLQNLFGRKYRFQLLSVAVLCLFALSSISKAATSAPAFLAPPLQGGQGGRSGSGTALPDLFTGTMSSSVPIEVPRGRKGMDPGLSLDYRSNNGDGWVGVGWELEIGAIERSGKFGVFYTDDNYVLRIGGATIDLVNIGTNEYRAKIESGFSRIKKMNATDGRPYWEVTDTTGTRYLFGQSIAARQDNPADANQIFRWCLDRVEDLNGNFMTTTYVKDQGQIYPKQIDYAGNGSLQPTSNVKFILEGRSDASTLYAAGFGVRTAFRLKAIQVYANSSQVRKYELQYDHSGVTSRSRVRSVIPYGKDFSSQLPTVEFSYQGGPENLFVYSKWMREAFGNTDVIANRKRFFEGDFNGDGKTDLL